jgi:hypothetical protein
MCHASTRTAQVVDSASTKKKLLIDLNINNVHQIIIKNCTHVLVYSHLSLKFTQVSIVLIIVIMHVHILNNHVQIMHTSDSSC